MADHDMLPETVEEQTRLATLCLLVISAALGALAAWTLRIHVFALSVLMPLMLILGVAIYEAAWNCVWLAFASVAMIQIGYGLGIGIRAAMSRTRNPVGS